MSGAVAEYNPITYLTKKFGGENVTTKYFTWLQSVFKLNGSSFRTDEEGKKVVGIKDPLVDTKPEDRRVVTEENMKVRDAVNKAYIKIRDKKVRAGANHFEKEWAEDPRWNGAFGKVTRPYSGHDVMKLRGTTPPRNLYGKMAAEKFADRLVSSWEPDGEGNYGFRSERSLSILNGAMAGQYARGGGTSCYVSGWQIAAAANTAGDMYTDTSTYPVNSGPHLVESTNNTLIQMDNIQAQKVSAARVKAKEIAENEASQEIYMAEAQKRAAATEPPTPVFEKDEHTEAFKVILEAVKNEKKDAYDAKFEELYTDDLVRAQLPKDFKIVDYHLPLILDIEAGFGGIPNTYDLTRKSIKAGAAAVHLEDQYSPAKKCGHMGGKVLVPTGEAVKKLVATRLACDVEDTRTVIIARTDANAAKNITGNVDLSDPNDPDRDFLDYTIAQPTDEGAIRVIKRDENGEPIWVNKDGGVQEPEYEYRKYTRTAEGMYRLKDPNDTAEIEVNGKKVRIRQGLLNAMARGVAYSPVTDVVWCETGTPSLAEAEVYADALHFGFKDLSSGKTYEGDMNKMLAYNCSPSFNWARNFVCDEILRDKLMADNPKTDEEHQEHYEAKIEEIFKTYKLDQRAYEAKYKEHVEAEYARVSSDKEGDEYKALRNRAEPHLEHYQRGLANKGCKYQFVTLSGIHNVWKNSFELQREYRTRGTAATAALQESEFALAPEGYTATEHQQEVGASHFDGVTSTVDKDSSVNIEQDGSTQDQF